VCSSPRWAGFGNEYGFCLVGDRWYADTSISDQRRKGTLSTVLQDVTRSGSKKHLRRDKPEMLVGQPSTAFPETPENNATAFFFWQRARFYDNSPVPTTTGKKREKKTGYMHRKS